MLRVIRLGKIGNKKDVHISQKKREKTTGE